MTDVRELIERARYTAEHGIFDANEAGKYASTAELTAALSAALAREEALREALRPFASIGDLINIETEGFDEHDEINLMFEDYLLERLTVRDFLRALALSENTNGN